VRVSPPHRFFVRKDPFYLGGKSDVIDRDHPLRYVPRAMQHPPNINVVWPLNVKHEMRIACQWPKAQTGQVQFVGLTR
jgi:hypothetical protein